MRQDIADELADHLQSSFTRELHFTPEETSAKQTVLDRFGDPRRVARKLWFDAMQEKLMSQRLNLVLSSLMTAACLGALALMGLMLRESRLATQALLEQSQAANSALLDKLAALAALGPAPAVAEPAKSMEWNSVKVRLVEGKSGGPPAVGFRIQLHGHLLDTAKEIDIIRTSGADGTVDLGLVRPGQHRLNVDSPWHESRSPSQLTVLPGQSLSEEIVCPARDREDSAVTFSVDWPEEFRERKFWLVGQAMQLAREVGGSYWSAPSSSRHQCIIVTDDGANLSPPLPYNGNYRTFEFAPEPALAGLSVDLTELPRVPFGPKTRAARAPYLEAAPDPVSTPNPVSWWEGRPFHFRYPDSSQQADARWPAAKYRFVNVLVVEPAASGFERGLRMANVCGGLISDFARNRGFLKDPSELPVPFSDWFTADPFRRSDAPQDRTNVQPEFELRAGEQNRVNVSLNPMLVEHVRAFVAGAK